MKASVMHEFGDAEVLKTENVRSPEPGAGELLIQVAACGINHYDLDLRRGAVFTDVAFPHVLGADVAGKVVGIGPGVGGWREGDAAIAAPGYPLDPADRHIKPENHAPSFEVTGTHTWGGYAELLRMPARFVLHDETGQSPEEVAAMPLVLMTAVHAVETLGEVCNDSRVLIQAGASGSGNACIQVAKILGAEVATTVGSNEKIETARTAGADLVINYNQHRFADVVLDWTDGVGADVVIDNVGGSVFEENLRALRLGGIFVNFGLVGGMKTTLNFRNLFFRHHQIRGSCMGSMAELSKGLEWLRQGKIKAPIDRTFPLEEAAAAHRYIESRAVKGKVVLIP